MKEIPNSLRVRILVTAKNKYMDNIVSTQYDEHPRYAFMMNYITSTIYHEFGDEIMDLYLNDIEIAYFKTGDINPMLPFIFPELNPEFVNGTDFKNRWPSPHTFNEAWWSGKYDYEPRIKAFDKLIAHYED